MVLSLHHDRFSQIPRFFNIRATDKIYLINLTPQPNSFTLYATPQLSQSGDRLCGTLSLTSIGLWAVTGSASQSECW